jgi:hypothetical protein
MNLLETRIKKLEKMANPMNPDEIPELDEETARQELLKEIELFLKDTDYEIGKEIENEATACQELSLLKEIELSLCEKKK